MGEKKRPTIAIMAGNTSSEYFKELIAGFRACAKEEDVNLVFFMGPHIPQHCKEMLYSSFSWHYDYQFHMVYDYVHYIKPDAIIVAYGSLSHFKYVPDVEEFVARFKGIPTLVLGDHVNDPDVPYLVGGNYGGMREEVRHLVEDHGYKKIAFVAGPRRNYDSNCRLKAYRDVLEEHNIPIDEGMIVYGNYTEAIEEEVNYLFDTYPDLEAIVFANDNMAKGGYRVCAARDLVVGSDIAIVGFDDGDIAKSLEPPLTSVAHSSFMFSYTAVQSALKLCRGEKPESKELQAYFRKRSSCGCVSVLEQIQRVNGKEELKKYLEYKAEIITDELFSSIPYEKDRNEYCEWMKKLFCGIFGVIFEDKSQEDVDAEIGIPIYKCLKRMCQHPFISKRLLLEYLENVMRELEAYITDKKQLSSHAALLKSIQHSIYSREINALYKENMSSERKMWFQPSFITDLINIQADPHEQIAYIMGRLKAMDIKSAYLFFSDEPAKQVPGEVLKGNRELGFVAYHNESEIKAFTRSEAISISKDSEGILPLLPQDEARFYTAYPLFSGDEQYGMILCEIEHKDYPFMLSCSIQLGAFRRIVNMNMRELQMKRELEEKNRILSEISAYDELSKLYNRRGFLEHALKLIRKNKGNKLCMIFADVDHLKEINDSFGHSAGDFAIITAAEYLRQCMPKKAITARLGGDEFVSLFVLDEETTGEKITQNVKDYMRKFNAECEKPFVVEMSAGAYEFVSDGKTDIGELFNKSDELLYEQKRNRRKTVKKDV